MLAHRLDPHRPFPATDAAIFTGAGISDGPPAGLPTGDVFHRRLRELCLLRARPYTDGLIDPASLDAWPANLLNLLARVENTRPGAGAGALRAMTVAIPNETHLLAAFHLARGGFQLTMNFDDGIERAYALLSGAAELPDRSPDGFRRALEFWRARWPSGAPTLRVVSRSQEIASALPLRPLLVKVHGSLGRHVEGLSLSAPPMTDEPDPARLGADRSRAFEVLTKEHFVLVTGFSATDFASGEPLLGGLARGRFWWVAQEIHPDVRRRLTAIDPTQPLVGEPLDALRTTLGLDLPEWPRQPAPGSTFDERLERWAATLTPAIAAEALAWLLTDAGQPTIAAEILTRLLTDGAGPRTQLRLADAHCRRRWLGDVPRARRTFVGSALSRPNGSADHAAGQRSYALARWVETLDAGTSAPPVLATACAGAALLTVAAVSHLSARWRYPTSPMRTSTVACAVFLAVSERYLPTVLGVAHLRVPVRGSVRVTAAAARRVLDEWAHAPSARRRALLELQVLELETIDALLSGERPAATAVPRLRRLSSVFQHVGDPDGQLDCLAVRALVAVAENDLATAIRTLDEVAALRPDPAGVVALAARLLGRSGLSGAA